LSPVKAVATALSGLGLAASSQDTGGGISCVVLEHKDGGEISWGTADETWGAAITDADGKYVSSIETTCPSDSQDIAAIAEALLGPSVKSEFSAALRNAATCLFLFGLSGKDTADRGATDVEPTRDLRFAETRAV